VRAHPTPCSIVISEATMAHIGYARSRCLPKNFNVKKSSMPLMLPGIVDSMKSVFFYYSILFTVWQKSLVSISHYDKVINAGLDFTYILIRVLHCFIVGDIT
jgi:hypothetical protein